MVSSWSNLRQHQEKKSKIIFLLFIVCDDVSIRVLYWANFPDFVYLQDAVGDFPKISW